jgi:hypothetical protein
MIKNNLKNLVRKLEKNNFQKFYRKELFLENKISENWFKEIGKYYFLVKINLF